MRCKAALAIFWALAALADYAAAESLTTPIAVADACTTYAPFKVRYHPPVGLGEALNPSKAWNGWDTGIVVNAFVGLMQDGKKVDVYQGVDLSSNNRVGYDLFGKCKLAAAFVRIDTWMPHHLAQLQSIGVPVVPYYFMSLPKAYLQASRYAALASSDNAAIQRYLAVMDTIANEQVTDFVKHMQTVSLTDIAPVKLPGASVPFIAVDVEQKLTDERSRPARVFFGRFYARALCSWVRGVHTHFPQATVLLYTTPAVFGDYLNFAYPAENACLHGLPIWIARTTSDGGDVIRTSQEVMDQYSQRLCMQNAGNRCIMHQYSHRGALWSHPVSDDPHLPHVDLDRIFPLKVVPDSTGSQYVRQ